MQTSGNVALTNWKPEKRERVTLHTEWVSSLPCCICKRRPTTRKNDAHHVKTFGAGGTERDVIPLCRYHHQMFHQMFHQMGRWSFQSWAGFNLQALADEIWANSPHNPENQNPPLDKQ